MSNFSKHPFAKTSFDVLRQNAEGPSASFFHVVPSPNVSGRFAYLYFLALSFDFENAFLPLLPFFFPLASFSGHVWPQERAFFRAFQCHSLSGRVTFTSFLCGVLLFESPFFNFTAVVPLHTFVAIEIFPVALFFSFLYHREDPPPGSRTDRLSFTRPPSRLSTPPLPPPHHLIKNVLTQHRPRFLSEGLSYFFMAVLCLLEHQKENKKPPGNIKRARDKGELR